MFKRYKQKETFTFSRGWAQIAYMEIAIKLQRHITFSVMDGFYPYLGTPPDWQMLSFGTRTESGQQPQFVLLIV